MVEKIKRKIHLILGYFGLYVKRIGPRLSEKVIKENLGKDLIGVEIGVREGANARRMLENLPIKKLYLVDPYVAFKNILVEYSEEYLNEAKNLANRNLKKFEDRTIFISKKSEDAVNDIPDDLDFVYIDGDHTYEHVKKDIENYYPKLKIGGMLAGHDIGLEGVYTAVGEFAIKLKQVYMVEKQDADWVIIKKRHKRKK